MRQLSGRDATFPYLETARMPMHGRVPLVTNRVISNAPGPPVPRYLAGARMLHNLPTSIVTHGLGLNITVQSCDPWLDFALVAGSEVLPEVRELADDIAVAFDEPRALPAGKSDRTAKKPVPEATVRARGRAPTKRTPDR